MHTFFRSLTHARMREREFDRYRIKGSIQARWDRRIGIASHELNGPRAESGNLTRSVGKIARRVRRHAAYGNLGARSETASPKCASMRVLAAWFIALRLDPLRVALCSYYARSMSRLGTLLSPCPIAFYSYDGK